MLQKISTALEDSKDLEQFNGPIKEAMLVNRKETVRHTQEALAANDAEKIDKWLLYLERACPVAWRIIHGEAAA
jgi:hypothetical protein